MKKSEIKIKFDDEKLKAIKYYMGKKDADFEEELIGMIDKTYEKYVPQSTREYIEAVSAEEEKEVKPTKPKKDNINKTAEKSEEKVTEILPTSKAV